MRTPSIIAMTAALFLVPVVAGCRDGTSAPQPTATESQDNSAYLAETSRLIDRTNEALTYMDGLLQAPKVNDSEWLRQMALVPLGFGVYAEQWREAEPPEDYRHRHDLVQSALDRLNQVGTTIAKGQFDTIDWVTAESTFHGAADNLKKP